MKVLAVPPLPPALQAALQLLGEEGLTVDISAGSEASQPEPVAANYDLVVAEHPLHVVLLRRIRSNSETSGLPWASWGNQKDLSTALNDGADLFLDPEENAERLAARLQALARRARLGGAPRRDPLTGLVGKRSFRDILRQEFERASRHRRSLALLALEPDFPRSGNTDEEVEETLLQEIGHHLRPLVRDSDLLARLSGRRFGVVLPETDATGGVTAGQRLRAAVAGAPIPIPPRKGGAGKALYLTLSVGIAAFPSRGMERADDLLGRALESLVQAQRRGGDSVLLFGSSDIIWSREAPDPSRF